MNKIQKAGLAVVLASGISFAAPLELWTADAPYGIVQFPWIVDCMSDPGFDEGNSSSPCYKDMGGWWFGYVAGEVGRGDYVCGGYKSATNKVEAKINNEWVSFVGPDYTSCQGPAITDTDVGTSLLTDGYLEIRLTTGTGNQTAYQPDIAAFAVNLANPPNKNINLSCTEGFYLKYTSDHNESEQDLALELGWDESNETNNEWDTWYATIPSQSSPQIKTFKWGSSQTFENPGTSVKNVSGDFVQDNYAEAPKAMTFATQNMRAVKIRLKQYSSSVVNFKLYEFGFANDCPISYPTPTLPGSVGANPNLSLNLSGKMLSMTVKEPVPVQIINLQGAVVHSQTYAPSQVMNLSNLPTGIYMVRVPALGYSGKIILK